MEPAFTSSRIWIVSLIRCNGTCDELVILKLDSVALEFSQLHPRVFADVTGL